MGMFTGHRTETPKSDHAGSLLYDPWAMSPSERTSFPAPGHGKGLTPKRGRWGEVSEIAAIILVKVPFVKGGYLYPGAPP